VLGWVNGLSHWCSVIYGVMALSPSVADLLPAARIAWCNQAWPWPGGPKSTGYSTEKQRGLRQGSWLERGCESHPPSWAVHGGTRPQQRRREAGLEAEEDEPTGRNESEPHRMSLDISQTGDKPSPSSLGEGRWERVGQQPASAQRSGGVCVDSTSGRRARVTWEDSGDGR